MKRNRTEVVLLLWTLITLIMVIVKIVVSDPTDQFMKVLAILALMLFIIKLIVSDFKPVLDRLHEAWNGPPKKEELNEEESRLIATHEASHAVADWFLPHHPTPRSVTIVPGADMWGHVKSHRPANRFLTPSYYKDQIAAALASHAAEMLFFGEASTACFGDLQVAHKNAENMVRFYGMGDPSSPIAPACLTENTAWQLSRSVAGDVERIIGEQYERATKLVADHRSEIERVAGALLKRKTLETKDLEEILGKRPVAKPKT